jgi:periplasmic protein TonB
MLMHRNGIMSLHESGIPPRRAATIGGVALLHLAAVYALVSGMAQQIVKLAPPDIYVERIETTTPPKTTIVPQLPPLAQPVHDTAEAVPPVINIENADRTTIATTMTAHTQPPADSGASGISGTHSSPPYPLEARTLSHQGMVLLRLTISPKGDVVAANIVQSSGYAELDAAAVSWVQEHWKYKPAIQGGVAVTSQTQAAVKFDLKTVRG